jgi:hypothetical protein
MSSRTTEWYQKSSESWVTTKVAAEWAGEVGR